jgi:hypothetical protein
MSKITISKPNGEEEVRDMTSEEQAQYDADMVQIASEKEAEETAKAEKETLKASAKAKLIAGEPLTEDEANTIVL